MSTKYSRQSFLGVGSQTKIEETEIAVIGYGGGGSHVVQQLLHIGFRKIKVFDSDCVEDSNTHRLVGINYPLDVYDSLPKIELAKRMAQNIQGDCVIQTFKTSWQENADQIRTCKIVMGCVDSFDQRDQLETFCRRYSIYYIDIGMGVKIHKGDPPQMAGQVILSSPLGPCMRCLGFITDDKLNDDRSDYGDAGPQPQVIWTNGVLASLAVGIAVELVTCWTDQHRKVIYLSYNANLGEVETHPRLKYLKSMKCHHHVEIGPAKFIDL